VLLMELRERGYCGGYTMLKQFVASLRPKQAVEPVIRFETESGEQMQVDWSVIRRGSNRLSVFVPTLGWSRATYVEFVTDERVETLIEAHENAFLAFGGTPREVLYDNMRTVVLERHGYEAVADLAVVMLGYALPGGKAQVPERTNPRPRQPVRSPRSMQTRNRGNYTFGSLVLLRDTGRDLTG
jgi:hypothetical protein